MKRSFMAGLVVLVAFAAASCDFFGLADAPELQVIARANPGETAADMAHLNEINFGKPAEGVNEDVVFRIRNVGTADLILETGGPDFVAVIDQNESEVPFSILTGAGTNTIEPGQEVEVTVRFTGQNTSTRYTAKLVIPSNDVEHPDYFLNLTGDGVSF